jgi:hypothetical protein
MVKAVFVENWDHFDESPVAGSFSVCPPDEQGVSDFWYRCPCGCGVQGVLKVRANSKPQESPSWEWNGSTDKPTLHPSVNHVNHWHGWLTDGEWKVC